MTSAPMATQMRVVYDMGSMGQGGATDAPTAHPQYVMRKLADEIGFKVIGSVAQTLGDCWWFWIEYSEKPALPAYIHETKWLPVGTV